MPRSLFAIALAAVLPATGLAQTTAGRLPEVEIYGLGECVTPGMPEATVDSTSQRVLTALLRLGSDHRARVGEDVARVRYGYFRSVLSPRGTESQFPGSVLRKREQASWNYELGPIWRRSQEFTWEELSMILSKPTERNEYDGVVIRVPHVAQLTSPEFVDRHCFRARRVSGVAGDDMIALAFRSPARTRFIEFQGELLMDLKISELRQARLELSRFPDSGEPIESWEMHIAFTRRGAGASVIDSVFAVERFARSPDYRGNVLEQREGYRRLWP
jgi:hypothetical protein